MGNDEKRRFNQNKKSYLMDSGGRPKICNMHPLFLIQFCLPVMA